MQKDKYPRGKLNEDDEGVLDIAVGVQDKTLIVSFGKNISWFGLSKSEAIAFASHIMGKATEME